MRVVLLVAVFVLLSACANLKKDYVFDGSTEQSTQAGVSRVLKSLKPAEQMEFFMALMAIQFSDVSSVHDIMGDPTMTDEVNYFIIGKKINGLIYYQVLELAKASPTKVSVFKGQS